MNVEHCEGCDRDFLPSTCPYHCGPVCCRKLACRNARPHRENSRLGMIPLKRCIVCGAHGDWFEKFAPCVPKPIGSPRETPGCERVRYWMGYGMQYICKEHHPNTPERYHVKYCSLKCYNSWESGHRARTAIRQRQKWMTSGKQRRYYRKEQELAGGKLY